MATLPAIAILVLGAGLASGTNPGAARPAPAEETMPPDWVVIVATEGAGEAERAYRGMLARQLEGIATLNEAYLRFPLPSKEMSSQEGEFAGQWTFFASPGATRPDMAWKLRLPTTAPYRVQASLYCHPDDCPALRRKLHWLLAPKVEGDEALLAEWRKIVLTERCDPNLPVFMPSPIYPPEEQRRGIGGTVRLGILYNACGDVREYWIEASSGNRNLDRATIKQARKWRVDSPTPGVAGRAVTDVVFKFEDTPAP